jgi:hypothetical protein
LGDSGNSPTIFRPLDAIISPIAILSMDQISSFRNPELFIRRLMRKQILDRFLILGMCGLPCQWPGNIACMPLRIFYSERMEAHVLSKGENELNGRQAVSRFSVKADQEIEPKSEERRGTREIATPFNFCQRVRIDCDCLFNFRTKIR